MLSMSELSILSKLIIPFRINKLFMSKQQIPQHLVFGKHFFLSHFFIILYSLQKQKFSCQISILNLHKVLSYSEFNIFSYNPFSCKQVLKNLKADSIALDVYKTIFLSQFFFIFFILNGSKNFFHCQQTDVGIHTGPLLFASIYQPLTESNM